MSEPIPPIMEEGDAEYQTRSGATYGAAQTSPTESQEPDSTGPSGIKVRIEDSNSDLGSEYPINVSNMSDINGGGEARPPLNIEDIQNFIAQNPSALSLLTQLIGNNTSQSSDPAVDPASVLRQLTLVAQSMNSLATSISDRTETTGNFSTPNSQIFLGNTVATLNKFDVTQLKTVTDRITEINRFKFSFKEFIQGSCAKGEGLSNHVIEQVKVLYLKWIRCGVRQRGEILPCAEHEWTDEKTIGTIQIYCARIIPFVRSKLPESLVGTYENYTALSPVLQLIGTLFSLVTTFGANDRREIRAIQNEIANGFQSQNSGTIVDRIKRWEWLVGDLLHIEAIGPEARAEGLCNIFDNLRGKFSPDDVFHLQKVLDETEMVALVPSIKSIESFQKELFTAARAKLAGIALPSTEVCRDFTLGKCKQGDRCRYIHEGKPTNNFSSSHVTDFSKGNEKSGKGATKGNPRKPHCRDWLKGECSKKVCEYQHDERMHNAAHKVCPFLPNCSFGERCNFKHPKDAVNISHGNGSPQPTPIDHTNKDVHFSLSDGDVDRIADRMLSKYSSNVTSIDPRDMQVEVGKIKIDSAHITITHSDEWLIDEGANVAVVGLRADNRLLQLGKNTASLSSATGQSIANHGVIDTPYGKRRGLFSQGSPAVLPACDLVEFGFKKSWDREDGFILSLGKVNVPTYVVDGIPRARDRDIRESIEKAGRTPSDFVEMSKRVPKRDGSFVIAENYAECPITGGNDIAFPAIIENYIACPAIFQNPISVSDSEIDNFQAPVDVIQGYEFLRKDNPTGIHGVGDDTRPTPTDAGGRVKTGEPNATLYISDYMFSSDKRSEETMPNTNSEAVYRNGKMEYEQQSAEVPHVSKSAILASTIIARPNDIKLIFDLKSSDEPITSDILAGKFRSRAKILHPDKVIECEKILVSQAFVILKDKYDELCQSSESGGKICISATMNSLNNQWFQELLRRRSLFLSEGRIAPPMPLDEILSGQLSGFERMLYKAMHSAVSSRIRESQEQTVRMERYRPEIVQKIRDSVKTDSILMIQNGATPEAMESRLVTPSTTRADTATKAIELRVTEILVNSEQLESQLHNVQSVLEADRKFRDYVDVINDSGKTVSKPVFHKGHSTLKRKHSAQFARDVQAGISFSQASKWERDRQYQQTKRRKIRENLYSQLTHFQRNDISAGDEKYDYVQVELGRDIHRKRHPMPEKALAQAAADEGRDFKRLLENPEIANPTRRAGTKARGNRAEQRKRARDRKKQQQMELTSSAKAIAYEVAPPAIKKQVTVDGDRNCDPKQSGGPAFRFVYPMDGNKSDMYALGSGCRARDNSGHEMNEAFDEPWPITERNTKPQKSTMFYVITWLLFLLSGCCLEANSPEIGSVGTSAIPAPSIKCTVNGFYGGILGNPYKVAKHTPETCEASTAKYGDLIHGNMVDESDLHIAREYYKKWSPHDIIKVLKRVGQMCSSGADLVCSGKCIKSCNGERCHRVPLRSFLHRSTANNKIILNFVKSIKPSFGDADSIFVTRSSSQSLLEGDILQGGKKVNPINIAEWQDTPTVESPSQQPDKCQVPGNNSAEAFMISQATPELVIPTSRNRTAHGIHARMQNQGGISMETLNKEISICAATLASRVGHRCTDAVISDHAAKGHVEYAKECPTCTMHRSRSKAHRRNPEAVRVGTMTVDLAELGGGEPPTLVAMVYDGEKGTAVRARPLATKGVTDIKNGIFHALLDCEYMYGVAPVQRLHCDREAAIVTDELAQNLVKLTITQGHDPQANGAIEGIIGQLTRLSRCAIDFIGCSFTRKKVWGYAMQHSACILTATMHTGEGSRLRAEEILPFGSRLIVVPPGKHSGHAKCESKAFSASYLCPSFEVPSASMVAHWAPSPPSHIGPREIEKVSDRVTIHPHSDTSREVVFQDIRWRMTSADKGKHNVQEVSCIECGKVRWTYRAAVKKVGDHFQCQNLSGLDCSSPVDTEPNPRPLRRGRPRTTVSVSYNKDTWCPKARAPTLTVSQEWIPGELSDIIADEMEEHAVDSIFEGCSAPTCAVTRECSAAEWSSQRGKDARREEVRKLLGYSSWSQMPIEFDDARREYPEGTHSRTRMLTSIKHIELPSDEWTYKGRFVVRGDNVRHLESGKKVYVPAGSMWAPVTSLDSFRLVVAQSLITGCRLESADIESAYLQTELPEGIHHFISLAPEVVEHLPEEVQVAHRSMRRPMYKMNRAIYGFHLSGKIFIEKLLSSLTEVGWDPTTFDGALLRKGNTLIATYVGDIITAGSDASGVWSDIKQVFNFREVGPCDNFLNIKIHHYMSDNFRCIDLDMGAYAKLIGEFFLKSYGRSPRHSYIPCTEDLRRINHQADPVNAKLGGDESRPPDGTFTNQHGKDYSTQESLKIRQTLIGMILWICRCTRPDISFATSVLSSNIACWTDAAEAQMEAIVGYIVGSQDFVLKFRYHVDDTDKDLIPRSATDSDWTYPRSQSGGFFSIVSRRGTYLPIGWFSKKQSICADSSTAAEVIACHFGLKQSIPAARAIFPDGRPVWTVGDNKGNETLVRRGHSLSMAAYERAIGVKVSLLRDLELRSVINFDKIDGRRNESNMFTKMLARLQFTMERYNLGVDFPVRPQENSTKTGTEGAQQLRPSILSFIDGVRRKNKSGM